MNPFYVDQYSEQDKESYKDPQYYLKVRTDMESDLNVRQAIQDHTRVNLVHDRKHTLPLLMQILKQNSPEMHSNNRCWSAWQKSHGSLITVSTPFVQE